MAEKQRKNGKIEWIIITRTVLPSTRPTLTIPHLSIPPDSPPPIDSDVSYRVLAVFLWALITYCIYFVLIKNGRDIVNNPVLEKSDSVAVSKKRD